MKTTILMAAVVLAFSTKSHACIGECSDVKNSDVATAVVSKSASAKTLASNASQKIVNVTAMSWGKTDESGLQLGAAQVNHHSSTILGLIRNAGSEPVAINLFGIDKRMSFTVWARQVGTKAWRQLRFIGIDFMIFESVGPSAYRVLELVKNQEMSYESLIHPPKVIIRENISFPNHIRLLSPHKKDSISGSWIFHLRYCTPLIQIWVVA